MLPGCCSYPQLAGLIGSVLWNGICTASRHAVMPGTYCALVLNASQQITAWLYGHRGPLVRGEVQR